MREKKEAPIQSGLVACLIHSEKLAANTIDEAIQKAKQQDLSLQTYLVKNKIMNGEILAKQCAEYFGLPQFDLEQYNPTWLHNSALTLELIRKYRVVPLSKENGILFLGIADPSDQTTLNAISFHTGLSVYPMIVAENQLQQFIETHCKKALLEPLEFKLTTTEPQDVTTNFAEETLQSDEPLIRFVDETIQHALEQHASDIHIEPYENHCRIRLRQDGILHEIANLPLTIATRLAARLKVMAKLDISERRLPQDGRFSLNFSQFPATDFRISTCPTLFGEKIVLRILDANRVALDIQQLGFENLQREIFLKKISEPQGMILVTGPTGSGKTVSLYSALALLNTLERNISTVEDPVEINLTGINQVNVNSKIGLNFATVLRTFLRQDPDVIMLGEIRDLETAEIAISAAQTGHLVLTTLHTNGALETLTRLSNMGVAAFNIACSVTLIVAQRLARKLCEHCKRAESVPKQSLRDVSEFLPDQDQITFYQPVGCKHCHAGFSGRTGIYEFLPISERIRDLILHGANQTQITELAEREGFKNLRAAGIKKVLQGITSLAEINRVIRE